VELFFNLVWGILSVSLGIVWIAGLRDSHGDSPTPDKRAQLIALTMLILILLPVISLTDDMQAMSTAEVEHITRRADLLPLGDQPVEFVSLLETTISLSRYLPHMQTFALLAPSIQGARPLTGCIRQMANRPPPASV
jgi:hypothetical protein